MTRRRVEAAALAALMATASGCATRPPQAGDEVLSGRLQVSVDATAAQPGRSLTAAFELRGDAEHGELQLATPLGMVLASARWAPGSAVLATAGGPTTTFEDLDALSREALGEALPLRALPDWLRGRPWPGAPSQPTQPPREPGFEQLGWSVGLARFAEGWVLARRENPPAVTVRARMDRDS